MTIKGLERAELRDLILSVGTHRRERRLTPAEVGARIAASLNAGTSADDLAEALTLDKTMLKRFTRLLTLPPEIQEAVDWGTARSGVSMTAAWNMARLDGSDDQREVARAVVEAGLSAQEVRQVVETRERSKQPIEKCIEAALKLRPVVTRRFLFVGAVRLAGLRSALQHKTQEERDSLLREVISRHHAGAPDWRGRLGARTFSLAGDAFFAAWAKNLPGDFEAEVNRCLEESVPDAPC